MALDILGVIKRLFTLSSYNLTFQLIIINLIIVFLGLIFLSYFNFNLIQNNKFIDNRDQSIRLNLSNITKYLENTSILRVPIFQYDYRCRYLQDIYNDNHIEKLELLILKYFLNILQYLINLTLLIGLYFQ